MATNPQRFWLMKTEPTVFSFEDLIRAPQKTTSWEGVRNYQARNFMRDDFHLGDLALIYHSNIDEPAAVGIAEVVREGYADTAALDSKSKYFDEKSKKKGESAWVMVDVRAKFRFVRPVTLAVMRSQPLLKNMVVLRKGARLSIQPVTAGEFDCVRKLGEPRSV